MLSISNHIFANLDINIIENIWYSRSPLIIFFVDIDECATNPCQNGGSCADQINGYTCSCVDGYDGINCENGKYAISH